MRRFLVHADATGEWSLRVPELGLGTTIVQARVLGRGGAIASPASAVATIVTESGLSIDAPAMPVHGYLPALTGTALPGATVRLTIDGADLRQTVAGIDGAWSIDLSDVVEGGTWWLAVWQQTGLFEHPPVVLPLTIDPYEAETWAVLDRWDVLGTPASKAREEWLDTTILRPLVAADVLSVSDRLGFPGRAHSELAARVNFANPGVGDFVPVNSPGFVPDVGYITDGIASHLSMGLVITPAFAGTRWQLDSTHSWMRVAGTTAGLARQLFGQTGGATTIGMALNNANNLAAQANASGVTLGAAGGVAGLFLAARTDAGHVAGYRDGALLSEQASVAAAPAANRTIVAMRNGSTYAAGIVEALGIGGRPSSDQREAIRAVCEAAWAEAPPA